MPVNEFAIVYSRCQKYIPLELLQVNVEKWPPGDFILAGKLFEAISAR